MVRAEAGIHWGSAFSDAREFFHGVVEFLGLSFCSWALFLVWREASRGKESHWGGWIARLSFEKRILCK